MSDLPGSPFSAGASGELTDLLAAARDGDRGAYDRVFEALYHELRTVASRLSHRLGAGESLCTTALVHEAYLRLGGKSVVAGNDRAHFFALAARAMRMVLLDHIRLGGRQKRGGRAVHLDVTQIALADAEAGLSTEDLIGLDRALDRLNTLDPDLGQLIEWRYFAGLTVDEIAEMTGVSSRTVKRNWQVARAFLLRELAGGGEPTATAP